MIILKEANKRLSFILSSTTSHNMSITYIYWGKCVCCFSTCIGLSSDSVSYRQLQDTNIIRTESVPVLNEGLDHVSLE